MTYTIQEREWQTLYGVRCWVIPGRAIVTATIQNSGTSNNDRANNGALTDEERAQRIYKFLSTHPRPISAHGLATYTSQGSLKITEILESRPDLFEIYTGPRTRGQNEFCIVWTVKHAE